MSDDEAGRRSGTIESDVRDMKLEERPEPMEMEATIDVKVEGRQEHSATPNGDSTPHKPKQPSSSQSLVKMEHNGRSPPIKPEHEEVIGGDITLKVEPGKAPKLARTTSQKVIARPPPLFTDEPDKTAEATSVFEVIRDCTYQAKYLGTTEHDALECDCSEEWDPATKTNNACGEDSDCINRATKMECIGDCGCGADCQNQRFQRRQYANVTVFKTEKKGYGLRANADLQPNDFIFEYIGEVIAEASFRRRMHQYDQEGIKHFYFMSLSKGEFVDATKRGNLGRFCNHSCNPNCYVDKWVVGEKLRMGIFAERRIKAGEELVFNYNVDRYGADPQPCYCGEPNCTGFIGGKTQSDRATKLSNTTIEALGIDDGDGWDIAVAKKPRKKKTGEDDEEYVNNVQPKSLEEDGVTKVMATLMQCKEKWIAVKLLKRIQDSDDDRVRHRVVRMHGYIILKSVLSNFMDDVNVVGQILDLLFKLPRITRNKIEAAKIEDTVRKLTESGDDRIKSQATELLTVWGQLEMGFRITKVKRDPKAEAALAERDRFERREALARAKPKSPSPEPPKGPAAPSGPRSNIPQRNANFFARPPRPPFQRGPPPLPNGWSMAMSDDGKAYYYTATGEVTWQRPTLPASLPPPPPKEKTHEQKLQDIIRGITESATATKQSNPGTPQPQSESRKDHAEPKWKSWPVEKQRKQYSQTLHPTIMYVVNKYKGRIPKDELKHLAKQISTKIVDSDFKRGRVTNINKLDKKTEKNIKSHVKDYFDKAYKKHKEKEKRKAADKAANGERSTKPESEPTLSEPGPAAEPSCEAEKDIDVKRMEMEDEDEVQLTDNEDEEDEPTLQNDMTPTELKRKRDHEAANGTSPDDTDSIESKRIKSETDSPAAPPPPPPPPPPPMEDRAFQDEANGDLSGALHDAATESMEDAEAYMARNGKLGHLPLHNGISTPTQLATPPTNGSSYRHDEVDPNSS